MKDPHQILVDDIAAYLRSTNKAQTVYTAYHDGVWRAYTSAYQFYGEGHSLVAALEALRANIVCSP